MKGVFLFCYTIVLLATTPGVRSAIDELLKDDFFHIYKNAAIETRDIQNKPVTADKVKYYFYTKSHPSEALELDPNDPHVLTNSTRKLVFMIHGWTDSRDSQWYEDMKNAFLLQDYDVIQVDWRDPANQLYYVSSINTYDVSKHIANFLVDLTKNHGVDLGNILCVGHSLGGQTCGFVGKNFYKLTLKKLPRIVALDPAGPLFIARPDNKRLNKNDAEIVEVVHTDGGTFGYKDNAGTIDFFVNGGSTQPGCKTIDLANILGSYDEPLMCDHRRAWAYFTEAVLNPTEFVATKCSNWAAYKVNYCQDEEGKGEVSLGNLSTTAEGSFYLETNKEKPYAKKRSSGFSLSKLFRH